MDNRNVNGKKVARRPRKEMQENVKTGLRWDKIVGIILIATIIIEGLMIMIGI